MRKQIAAANWKMNLSHQEASDLLDQLVVTDHSLSAHQAAIFAVPAIYIPLAVQKLAGKHNVFVAAQNCHSKSNGAYTGEIAAAMYASVGVQHIVLGHSERREYFTESDALLAEKEVIKNENSIKILLNNGNEFYYSHSKQQTEFANNDGFEFKVFLDNNSL